MIENAKQYEVTKEKRNWLLSEKERILDTEGLHRIQRRVYLDAIDSEVLELNEQIEKWEREQGE